MGWVRSGNVSGYIEPADHTAFEEELPPPPRRGSVPYRAAIAAVFLAIVLVCFRGRAGTLGGGRLVQYLINMIWLQAKMMTISKFFFNSQLKSFQNVES